MIKRPTSNNYKYYDKPKRSAVISYFSSDDPKDQEFLKGCYKVESESFLRERIVSKIQDQEFLKGVLNNDRSFLVRLSVVSKISNIKFLKERLPFEHSKKVREIIIAKISATPNSILFLKEDE